MFWVIAQTLIAVFSLFNARMSYTLALRKADDGRKLEFFLYWIAMIWWSYTGIKAMLNL